MKKFTSLLIGVSLVLTGAAFAQQPEEQSTPGAGKKQGAEKTQQAEPKAHAAEAQPGPKAANPEATAAKQTGAMKETGAAIEPGAGKGRKHATEKSATATGTETGVSAQTGAGVTTEQGAGKGRKARATEKSATSATTGTDVSAQPTASAMPGMKHQKGMKAGGANAKTMPTAAPSAAASATAAPITAASATAAPVTAASASVAPSVAGPGQQTAVGTAAVKADPQKVQQVKQQVQQIKQQHSNFKAQPRPDKVPAVTFSASYRIQGSDRWQGPQYEVYRSYHPERHDRGWYSSRYKRVELIGGGYYYMNNGYWYPAWGYSPSEEYYAYDGPIYVGHRSEPPDRVIADVQAELQEMGYYTGEVDGLLGPLTRAALASYQAEQGLTPTAAIDEPTLDSLGMG